MYSLVSAPVLGFDLTRLSGGSATAEVLLRGLRLQASDLPVLAERLPDEGVRGPLWVEVESAARRMPSLKGMAKEDPAAEVLATYPDAAVDEAKASHWEGNWGREWERRFEPR